MEPTSPWSSKKLYSDTNEQDGTQKQPIGGHFLDSKKVYKNFLAALDTIKLANVRIEVATANIANNSQAQEIIEDKPTNIETERRRETDTSNVQNKKEEAVGSLEQQQENGAAATSIIQDTPTTKLNKGKDTGEGTIDETNQAAMPETPVPEEIIEGSDGEVEDIPIDRYDTGKMVVTVVPAPPPLVSSPNPPSAGIKRGTAVLLIALLAIVALARTHYWSHPVSWGTGMGVCTRRPSYPG